MEIGQQRYTGCCKSRQKHRFISPKTQSPIFFDYRWQAHRLIVHTLSDHVTNLSQLSVGTPERPGIELCETTLQLVVQHNHQEEKSEFLIADRCQQNLGYATDTLHQFVTKSDVQMDRRYENALLVWARRNDLISLADELGTLHLLKSNSVQSIGEIAETLRCDTTVFFKTIFRMICDCKLSIDLAHPISLDTQVWPTAIQATSQQQSRNEKPPGSGVIPN